MCGCGLHDSVKTASFREGTGDGVAPHANVRARCLS